MLFAVVFVLSRMEAGREDEGERVEVIVLVEVRRLRLILGRGEAIDMMGCMLFCYIVGSCCNVNEKLTMMRKWLMRGGTSTKDEGLTCAFVGYMRSGSPRK